MTRYEQLQNKANLCRKAALRVNGEMRKVWLDKAMELEYQALNLPVTAASRKVGE